MSNPFMVALGGGQFAESLFDLLPDQCPQVFHFGRTLLVGQQGRDFADESAFVVLPAHLRHPFFAALAAVVDDAVAGRAEEPGRDLRHRIQRIGLYEAHEHVLQNIFGFFARGDAPGDEGSQLTAVFPEYFGGVIFRGIHPWGFLPGTNGFFDG